MKKEVFVSYDGKKLACFLWDDVTNPKGVIQIVHGMTSHMQRFKEFGEELNRRGYIAYGDDHRPHGETAGLENLGKAGKNNFSENVRDEIEITKMLKARFRLPVQLFSHSYGSFLAQSYITTDSALIDGLILSGSAYMGGLKLASGKLLTGIQRLTHRMDTPNKLLFAMTFVKNNKYFPAETLKNSWLSRDPGMVEQYNKDPYCNFLMTHGFYYSMMRGLWDTYKKSNLNRIRKDLPILIMSGSLDPLGQMGKKVRKLHDMYASLGISNLKLRIYEGARHELTSDPDKERILNDITDFFDANIIGK